MFPSRNTASLERIVMKVVLFEDDPDTGPRLLSEIAKNLPKSSTVELFKASALPKFRNIRLYEERLAEEVKSTRYRNATLWVTDRDLSRVEHYEGLSEAII